MTGAILTKPDDPRARARSAFLGATAFADAELQPLMMDASTRQYFRLRGGPSAALLMDVADAATSPPCPPEASERERRRLGYAACVRGSGSSLVAYGATSAALKARGLLVPDVLVKDEAEGFAIVSELKGPLMAEACSSKAGEGVLYRRAGEVLDRLRTRPADEAGEGWPVQTYDQLAYETEAALLHRLYLPKELGRELSDDEASELMGAWREVFARLSAPTHYVHRDFHAENLVVAEGQIGVLDFQDMMVGQAAYDWASLIEDARRDLGAEVASELYAMGRSGAQDPAAFETDYAVLAAQRNAKILGLFARLIHQAGKRRYRPMLTRVREHLVRDLNRPPLAPVRKVLARVAPEVLCP